MKYGQQQCRGVTRWGRRCNWSVTKRDLQNADGWPLCNGHKDQRPPWVYPDDTNDQDRPEPWSAVQFKTEPDELMMLYVAGRAIVLATPKERLFELDGDTYRVQWHEWTPEPSPWKALPLEEQAESAFLMWLCSPAAVFGREMRE